MKKKKTVREVKMHKLLVCACKSQDLAQSQKKVERSHNRETVTFRNSAAHMVLMAYWNFTSGTYGVLELPIYYLWSTGAAHLVIMD